MTTAALTGEFFGWMRLGYVNGREWTVINPPGHKDLFGFLVREADSTERLFIPKNEFETDFASIPRLFWRVLPPVGDGARARYGLAAVIHDWLYVDAEESLFFLPADQRRRYADDVFLACMVALEVSPWRRRVMYRAVRLFGRRIWNRRHKQGGNG